MQHWVLDELLPLAQRHLLALELDAADVTDYLRIIAARVRSGRNGADWQRRFLARYGADWAALTQAYLERQRSGAPVHEWTV